MTRLLQQAFATVSTSLSQEDQDRLAQLMIQNLDRLEEILEDAMDEQAFEGFALEAVESDRVQKLLRRVAEKHSSTARSVSNSE